MSPVPIKKCPLPKTIDRRIPRIFLPENSNYTSGHTLDLYSEDVYDFQSGMPGKGVFANSAAQPITIDAVTYHTVEHYWQCMSCCDDPKLATQVFFAQSVQDARDFASEKKHSAWDSVKKDVMRVGVQAKIRQHHYVLLELLATGNRYIANTDGSDKFLGTGRDGSGGNALGELYMDERRRLLTSILQNRLREPIAKPTATDIEGLAEFLANDHPDTIEKKIDILMGRSIIKGGSSELLNKTYPKPLALFVDPQHKFNPAGAIANIKKSSFYQDHQCRSTDQLFRPDEGNKEYADILYERYNKIIKDSEQHGVKYYHDLQKHHSVNPIKKIVGFWTEGVGPLPGHLTIALIGAIICVGLLASGVGAVAIPFVAAAFSMFSGGMQGWKSAQQNGLSFKNTIIATIAGALTGLLAPWPFAGPLMTAVYVKAGAEACKLTKSVYNKVHPSEMKDRNTGIDVGAEKNASHTLNMGTVQSKASKLQESNDKILSPSATPSSQSVRPLLTNTKNQSRRSV